MLGPLASTLNQYFKHKSQEKILLGFLHGLKPLVESAAAGHPIAAHTWAGQLQQIHDMLARLQPPAKKQVNGFHKGSDPAGRCCFARWQSFGFNAPLFPFPGLG